MEFLRIVSQYRLSLAFLTILSRERNRGNNTLLRGLYFQLYGLRGSRGGRLFSTLSSPRPVFDPEAQTRRELGTEGLTEESSRRSPQREPMVFFLSVPRYPT